MVTPCKHFVCNGCKAEIESAQKAADRAASFLHRWLRFFIPAPRDGELTNVPDAIADDNTCCRCGTAVAAGGSLGNGAFYTEREPTYGWPFCSCR